MTQFFFFGGDLCNHLKETDFLKTLRLKHKVDNILFFPYAIEERFWDEKFEKYQNIIKGKNLNITTHKATLDAADVLSKLDRSQALIFGGGDERLITRCLERIGLDLKNIIRNKIVLGNSAGTNVFSEIYFSNDRQKVEAGTGICPIKIICHYDETKKDRVNTLKGIGRELPIFPLRSEQFIEYSK